MDSIPELGASHLAMLAASGISTEFARRRRYETVTDRRRLDAVGISPAARNVPGLLIPLLRADGTVSGYQYRPDQPRTNGKGKPLKYETPCGQPNRLDVPPGVGTMLADVNVPLWVTEGTKKGDCGAVHKLCIIALSGVWNWLGKLNDGTNDTGPLVDWDEIPLKKRKVIIAFDGDVSRKPEVRAAMTELAKFLKSREAVVRYLWLPDTDEKTGIDDYLASHTVAELQELIHANPPSPNLLAGMRDGEWLDSQQFSPLEYSVPAIVPEGMTILVGPPKSLKSWMVAAIGLAVADGKIVFGHLPVKQRPVLYLALEDGDRRLQERFRLLQDGAPLPARMHYMTKVAPEQVIPTIEAFLARCPNEKPLIILDTFGKVKPPKRSGQESYQADYDFAGALKETIDKCPGASLLVVHHTRKMAAGDFIDAVSGTHGIAGAADAVLVLKRERLKSEAVLAVTGRDVPEREYALLLKDDVRWWLDGTDLIDAAEKVSKRHAEAEDNGKLGGNALWVLAFVSNRPHQTTTAEDVIAAWPEKPTGDDEHRFSEGIRQTLRRLAKLGRILKVGRGVYMPHTVPVTTPDVSEVSEVSADQEACSPESSDVLGDVLDGQVKYSAAQSNTSNTSNTSSLQICKKSRVAGNTSDRSDTSPHTDETAPEAAENAPEQTNSEQPPPDLCWICLKAKPVRNGLCESCEADQ
jgi:AAA domain/Domain of unknown function (DUF3854)